MLVDLGQGLILRRTTAGDADALAAFNADQIRGQDAPAPWEPLGVWTRDLVGGRHPTFKPEDGLVVEDTVSGVIVSSMLLISQRWEYGGESIGVGQTELVATRPEFRGRGLVRRQFEVLHGWSAERGEVLQIIAGVPWFYRQFGYEMALERGGGPRVDLTSLEPPPPDAELPFRVRPMVEADLPFAAALDAQARARSAVTVPRDEALWRYELMGHGPGSATGLAFGVIETASGEAVGTLSHIPVLWNSGMALTHYEVKPGVSWRATWPAVLRYLLTKGQQHAARDPKARFTQIQLWHMGSQHPLYRAVRFGPDRWRAYALYTRIADLPVFCRAIAPALERRLAASPLAGHTGDLTLSTYRTGVRLRLDAGHLTVEPWRPALDVVGQEFGLPSAEHRRPTALFPDLTINQLLLGYRSLDELEAAWPDCMVRGGEGRALIDTLFPKAPSDVWPLV
jgi:hypothetical protein